MDWLIVMLVSLSFCPVRVALSVTCTFTQQSIGKVQVAELCLPCITNVLIVSLRLLSQLCWLEVVSVDCCLSLWVFFPDKLSARLVGIRIP